MELDSATSRFESPLCRPIATFCLSPPSESRDKQLRRASDDLYIWLNSKTTKNAVTDGGLEKIATFRECSTLLVSLVDQAPICIKFSPTSQRHKFDVELERAISVLVCVHLCSSNDAELLADAIERFERVITFLTRCFTEYHSSYGEHIEKYQHILDPLLNSQKVWHRLGSLLRSSSDRVASQAANLVSMLAHSTLMGHFEPSWTILLEPLARTMSRLARQFLKEELSQGGAVLGVYKGERYKGIADRGLGALISMLNSLAPLDDQQLLTKIAANKYIRDMILLFATPLHRTIFSAELIAVQSKAFHALELLAAPPLDQNDAPKVALWHQRLSAFDWKALLPQMADSVFNLLDDKDIWKSASLSSVQSFGDSTAGQLIMELPIFAFAIYRHLSLFGPCKKLLAAPFKGSPFYIANLIKIEEFGTRTQNFGPSATGWRALQRLSTSRCVSVLAKGSGPNHCFFVRDIGTMASEMNKMVFNLRSEEQRGDLGSQLAAAHKAYGNTYFNQGDFVMAIYEYSQAIRLVASSQNPLKSILLSNRAQARLNLQRAQEALDDANAALALDPTHSKSIERRKKALEMLSRNLSPLAECRTERCVWILSQLPRWQGPSLQAAVSVELKNVHEIDAKAASSSTTEAIEDRDWAICPICIDAKCSKAIVPCGHTFCASCTSSLKFCALCRGNITNVISIFL